MSESVEISHQLRMRRRELGLSLGQLARRADTSAPTLSRYEKGWARFEVSTLRKLATALRCDLVVRLEPRQVRGRRPRGPEVVEKLGRLFWDTPLAEEHLEEYPIWVVERVLELGDLGDVRLLAGHLGRETFLDHVCEARFSSHRTRLFWEEIVNREGKSCTRRFSRREAATSWQDSRS